MFRLKIYQQNVNIERKIKNIVFLKSYEFYSLQGVLNAIGSLYDKL